MSATDVFMLALLAATVLAVAGGLAHGTADEAETGDEAEEASDE